MTINFDTPVRICGYCVQCFIDTGDYMAAHFVCFGKSLCSFHIKELVPELKNTKEMLEELK